MLVYESGGNCVEVVSDNKFKKFQQLKIFTTALLIQLVKKPARSCLEIYSWNFKHNHASADYSQRVLKDEKKNSLWRNSCSNPCLGNIRLDRERAQEAKNAKADKFSININDDSGSWFHPVVLWLCKHTKSLSAMLPTITKTRFRILIENKFQALVESY